VTRLCSCIIGIVVTTSAVPADSTLTRIAFFIPNFEIETFELDMFTAVL